MRSHRQEDNTRMSTHNGYTREIPYIRVDDFAVTPNPFSADSAHFFFLTHAHTDHLVGLNSPTFSGQIFCTAVTKLLLLQTMEAGERVMAEELKDRVGNGKRKFANLRKRSSTGGGRAIDLIKTLEINVRTQLDGPQGPLYVTALDANHCPGSCIFLFESSTASIMVTGDIRAEDWWIAALRRNPSVQKYVVDPSDFTDREHCKLWPTLDCIYIDNTVAQRDEEFVSKEDAVRGLVELIRSYPQEAKFFLNSWTWGYEDMMKAIAKVFDTKIHLDAYKAKIYSSAAVAASDPLLSSLSTSSTTKTRFHACERRWKCDAVWADGRGCYEFAEEWIQHLAGPKKFKRPGRGEGSGGAQTIYVNPVAMERWKWRDYLEKTRKQLGELRDRNAPLEEWPASLITPLARHSPLPELQRFVALFRPRSLYPLTIPPDDPTCSAYLFLAGQFAPVLSTSAISRINAEARVYADSVRKSRGQGPFVMSSMDVDVVDGPFAVAEKDMVGGGLTRTENVEGGEEVVKMVQELERLQKRKANEAVSEAGRERKRKAKDTADHSSSISIPVSTFTARSRQSTPTPPSPDAFMHVAPPRTRPPPSIPTSLFYPSSSSIPASSPLPIPIISTIPPTPPPSSRPTLPRVSPSVPGPSNPKRQRQLSQSFASTAHGDDDDDEENHPPALSAYRRLTFSCMDSDSHPDFDGSEYENENQDELGSQQSRKQVTFNLGMRGRASSPELCAPASEEEEGKEVASRKWKVTARPSREKSAERRALAEAVRRVLERSERVRA